MNANEGRSSPLRKRGTLNAYKAGGGRQLQANSKTPCVDFGDRLHFTLGQPMKEQRPSASPIRFGVYEVDLVSEELRKNGLKIRLTDQPFQVMTILLERPGQVVTREELQKKLWPEGRLSISTIASTQRSIRSAKRWATQRRILVLLRPWLGGVIGSLRQSRSPVPAYFLRKRDVNQLNNWTLRFASPVPVCSVILGRLCLRNLSPLRPCRQSGGQLAFLLSFQLVCCCLRPLGLPSGCSRIGFRRCRLP